MPIERSSVTDPDERVLERYLWVRASRIGSPQGANTKWVVRSAIAGILDDLGTASRECGLPIERVAGAVHRLYPGCAPQSRVEQALRREDRRSRELPLRPVKGGRMFARASRGIVDPFYLISVALIAAGIGWIALTHAFGAPYGLFMGPVLVGGGVGFGAGHAGVPAHWAVILTIVVIAVGILLDFFAVLGPAWTFI